MSNTESPEARELSLVGKVEMKVALVSGDDKLQSTLNTYLPPLLLKLASEHVSVRNKVIAVCQHLNTRIKPPSIKLPVATLLKQYKDHQNALIRHFDLLYIQQGIDRLPVQERLDLLPTLLNGLSNDFQESTSRAATLFNLFLKLLHSMTFPPRGSKEDIALRERLGLAERPNDATFISRWLGKLILFGLNQLNQSRCPGLNKEECSFLQLFGKQDTWNPGAPGGLNLVETKVLASKFLASGSFVDPERFLPALFASADANSRISDIGDDILKRATSAISFEDPVLIKDLYELYLGTRGNEGSLPARIPLQTKILSLLCRSKLASSFIAQSTQIVQEALAPARDVQQNGVAGPTKSGLETSKLRGQVFAFTNWLARISTPDDINAFAPVLVGELRSYIESQGWPRCNVEDSAPNPGEIASRAYGYESIGLLAAACPEKTLLDSNLDMLRWLFTSLSEDASGKDVSTSIEQALSSVLGAIGGNLGSEIKTSLTSLLLHHMNLDLNNGIDDIITVKSTRYIAVRFANRCLPFSNTAARWIDVLAMEGDANERSAILEEGKKGLDPYWYKMLNPAKDERHASDNPSEAAKYELPSFPVLVDRFFGADSVWNITAEVGISMVNAYIPALSFCRCVMLHQALKEVKSSPAVDADWERNIDALVANDEDARGQLQVYLRDLLTPSATNQDSSRAIRLFLKAAYIGMTSQRIRDSSKAGGLLLEIISLLPSSAYSGLSADLTSIQEPIISNDRLLREKAARTFGILASLEDCSDRKSKTMLKTFDQKINSWREAIGGEVLQVHGAILAVTFYLSRSMARGTNSSDSEKIQSKFIVLSFDMLQDSRDKTLLDAIYVAISELSLFSNLRPATVKEPNSMPKLVEKITDKAKEGEEKAIIALGYLAIQCDEDPNEGFAVDNIVGKLYDLHTVRQPEAQFAVGAALSCAAIGWKSKYLVSAMDVQAPPPKSPARDDTLPSILDHVLLDCKTTKPALRQASVIWLLCLVEYCGHVDQVQGRLRECQVAFKGFLADRDSLNQESASRGLTLVYEKGNRALKNDLIRDLVGSFTETKANFAGTVSEDTELFDAGALPTGDGSVTTYKDIMSLASEVGDSSLVYKFMSLASNNAIWSSRAAFGRFGLSNILSDASTDGYLAQNPKLYPALFRYRFDPNTNVRSSMNDIWAALVKEPSKTIDQNFDNIMKDLLKNILAKEWRVRQACAAAIADLVQGQKLEKYENYLTEIWELTYKVCDDIKESVRIAAMSLARVLTGILTRGLEAGESSARSSNKMLKQVLPFLLSPAGLESGTSDVQDFARQTLLKIIKSSNGQTLRPFVPDLVGRLLALLSSIEPEMINYLHLNADKYGMTAQELDDARLKHIRGSSMLEAIERCLDFLDEGSMPELQTNLENAIKTVVGLPSKVGCSRVLVSLSTRQNFIFKPYADHFLPLARKQVFDRNDTISSSYAAACGYLARLTSDEVLLKLVASCHKLYFDSDDERHRVIAGDIVYAISKHATDRFNALAGEILPFVFIAKHDIYDRARTLFDDTWTENVGGSRAVLLYLAEILALASQHLEAARWSVKHTSSFAVADVVTSSGKPISDANAKTIWPALEKALSGKTWEGKEIVLEALIQYAKNSTLWLQDSKLTEQVEKIVLRESKRNNLAYREHALGCLAGFVVLREKVDMYSQVVGIVRPIIEESLENSEGMDVESTSGGASSKSVLEATLANGITSLLQSINPSQTKEENLITCLTQTLELLDRIRAQHGNRKIIDAIYGAQMSLFDKMRKSQGGSSISLSESLDNTLSQYVKQMFTASDQVEQTRIKAAEAAVAMAPIARKGSKTKTTFAQGLAKARQEERSITVQQTLDRAKKLLDH